MAEKPEINPQAVAFADAVFGLSVDLASRLAVYDLEEDVILVALYTLTRSLEKRIIARSEASLAAAGETVEGMITNMHHIADGINEAMQTTAAELFPGVNFDTMTAKQQQDLIGLLLAKKSEMPRG